MKIKEDVLAVLSDCTINDKVLKINSGQLDRKMYVEVNKILETMGGKWDRKFKGHVYPENPTDKLEQLLLSGEIEPPKKYGYFPTPLKLVEHLIELADLKNGMLVLEPSAGQGAIVNEVAKIVSKDNVDCFELLPNNAEVLQKKGFKVECCDFLTVETKPLYDRVIMNPPFEKLADVAHVLHAFKCLKDGCKLVSVMSVGFTFRQDKKCVDFREFLKDHNGTWERNPDGIFKESGTMVNTVTVVIDRD